MGVGFWPGAIAAWCYPFTGFFVFWQGYQTANSVYWFPWLLLAVDRTVQGRRLADAIGLSLATAMVLLSGHADVAVQALLASGLFAVWRLFYGFKTGWLQPATRNAAMRLALGWFVGFLIAAPHLLPLLAYSQTSARMARRTAGAEERPPVGLKALPQTVLPDVYGSIRAGSYRLTRDNEQESTAAAYAGVVATLLLAPIAWCSRRRRSLNLFWTGASVFALSWLLNIPGFVQLFRLPGLNILSHNRLVFIVNLAVLAMAAVGLETLRKEAPRWRRWFLIPMVLTLGLCLWNAYRAVVLPEPLASELQRIIAKGAQVDWIRDLQGIERAQSWFTLHHSVAAAFCGLAFLGWAVVWRWPVVIPRIFPVLGVALLGDLLWFAHGRNVQSDPALYFPRVEVLRQVASAGSGRAMGYYCLPAALAGMCDLRDVRGYDGVDPARMVELVQLAAGPEVSTPTYALTQYLVPKAEFTADGELRLSPILDMLGVRFLVFRGSPPQGLKPAFSGVDYYAVTNARALPRAFVPSRAEFLPRKNERLQRLGSPTFDPREVAFTESPVAFMERSRGTVRLTEDLPTRVRIQAQMATPGIVVLSDHWDSGWKAYLNGKPSPVLRVNHAIRGVLAPAGECSIEFRYSPASLRWGFALAGFGVVLILSVLTKHFFAGRQTEAEPTVGGPGNAA